MDKDARIAELETQVKALTNIFSILHPTKKNDTITQEMLEKVYYNKIKSRSHMKDIPNFRNMMEDERKLWATKVIKARLFKVHHGDAFHWLDEGYRNQNLLFWHETDGIMFPYTEIDDYGSVPPCFVVGNGSFSPDHWSDMVDHNGLVFLSDELVAEIKENLVKKERKYGPVYTCTIDINDCSYVVETEGQEFHNNAFNYYEGTLTK
jgi:hypothetical protein